jgi:hypothetical protein
MLIFLKCTPLSCQAVGLDSKEKQKVIIFIYYSSFCQGMLGMALLIYLSVQFD